VDVGRGRGGDGGPGHAKLGSARMLQPLAVCAPQRRNGGAFLLAALGSSGSLRSPMAPNQFNLNRELISRELFTVKEILWRRGVALEIVPLKAVLSSGDKI
jgi:hypothetical protein